MELLKPGLVKLNIAIEADYMKKIEVRIWLLFFALWENLFTNGLVLFIIEKSTNHLCGYLELKSPASDMPESICI